jgi:hypothetical protein
MSIADIDSNLLLELYSDPASTLDIVARGLDFITDELLDRVHTLSHLKSSVGAAQVANEDRAPPPCANIPKLTVLFFFH